MAKITKKVANWLYSVLQPQYLHKEIAYSHLYHFLSAYLPQGFKVRTAVFTSASGQAQLLINLYGNLDCGTCLVPLNIWIPLNYPFRDENVSSLEPNGVPMVFVVPDNGLVIRPNNNVDSSGRFYHPFMSSWHENYTPTSQTKEFSLLSLMACLRATFEQNPPLESRKQSPLHHEPSNHLHATRTGPQLPPKRALDGQSLPVPIDTPRQGPPRRETTGPPLPQKPAREMRSPVQASVAMNPSSQTDIPERYRSPLPLPGEGLPSPRQPPPPIAPLQSEIHLPTHTWGPSYDDSSIYERYPPSGTPLSRSKTPQESAVSEVEDLMDKVTLEENREDEPILQEIAQKINEFLESEDSAKSAVPFIEEQQRKVNALHGQLSNHLKQAQANDENLKKHILYLEERIEAVSYLNQELQALDQINAESLDEISTSLSSGHKIKLDELIMPDSILVNQLYDTVADIKAHKDTIDLVSGNFKGEEELINDETMDTCIKSVRGLARELFWLEVTKSEIGKSMGLKS
ncbi:hypothetical protein CJJ07_004555 [Candidozyma auris]|nr:hypothetical protein CJJ07_004555 [[Candida] auris]QEL61467.1 hypothetical protein CJJ09_003613 [[Candida] auris]